MRSLIFTRLSKTEDAMAQRAIERGVGLERANVSRVEISAMVADFAAKGGSVRRFEAGESGSYDAVCAYLISKGYEIKYFRNRYSVKPVGKRGVGKSMNWPQVVALADELRAADGKEPLKIRRAA